MGKKSISTIGFLSGVVVGGVLGVLYAPDKGAGTRGKLSFRLNKYKLLLEETIDNFLQEKAMPLTTEAKSQGAKVVSEAKNKAERILGDVDDLLSQIREHK